MFRLEAIPIAPEREHSLILSVVEAGDSFRAGDCRGLVTQNCVLNVTDPYDSDLGSVR